MKGAIRGKTRGYAELRQDCMVARVDCSVIDATARRCSIVPRGGSRRNNGKPQAAKSFVAVTLADADTRIGPQQRGVNPSVISRTTGLLPELAVAEQNYDSMQEDKNAFSEGGLRPHRTKLM